MSKVQILAPNGLPAREQLSTWQGAGSGFGGQLERWQPRLQTVDAALLPNLKLGNARAEDVTRNNAFAANGVRGRRHVPFGEDRRLTAYPPGAWQARRAAGSGRRPIQAA